MGVGARHHIWGPGHCVEPWARTEADEEDKAEGVLSAHADLDGRDDGDEDDGQADERVPRVYPRLALWVDEERMARHVGDQRAHLVDLLRKVELGLRRRRGRKRHALGLVLGFCRLPMRLPHHQAGEPPPQPIQYH
jgi:hypothetical protein